MPNAQFHTGQNQNDVCSHSYVHRYTKCQIQNLTQQYSTTVHFQKSLKLCQLLLCILLFRTCFLPTHTQTRHLRRVFFFSTQKSLFSPFHPDLFSQGKKSSGAAQQLQLSGKRNKPHISLAWAAAP